LHNKLSKHTLRAQLRVEQELKSYQKRLTLLKEKQVAELQQRKEAEAKRIEADKVKEVRQKEEAETLQKAREFENRKRSKQVEVIEDGDEADAPPAKVSRPSFRSSSNPLPEDISLTGIMREMPSAQNRLHWDQRGNM
jgi:NCAIR mutase (PurE)-related protein